MANSNYPEGYYMTSGLFMPRFGAMIGPVGVAVYDALKSCTDKRNRKSCSPPISRLMKLTGLSDRAIQVAIGNKRRRESRFMSLEEAGLIRVERASGRANVYHFLPLTPEPSSPPNEVHPRTIRPKNGLDPRTIRPEGVNLTPDTPEHDARFSGRHLIHIPDNSQITNSQYPPTPQRLSESAVPGANPTVNAVEGGGGNPETQTPEGQPQEQNPLEPIRAAVRRAFNVGPGQQKLAHIRARVEGIAKAFCGCGYGPDAVGRFVEWLRLKDWPDRKKPLDLKVWDIERFDRFVLWDEAERKKQERRQSKPALTPEEQERAAAAKARADEAVRHLQRQQKGGNAFSNGANGTVQRPADDWTKAGDYSSVAEQQAYKAQALAELRKSGLT